jgi:hypothetical protein
MKKYDKKRTADLNSKQDRLPLQQLHEDALLEVTGGNAENSDTHNYHLEHEYRYTDENTYTMYDHYICDLCPNHTKITGLSAIRDNNIQPHFTTYHPGIVPLRGPDISVRTGATEL